MFEPILVPESAAIAGWLIALALFVILEAATVSLVSIWFAVGALAGLITSLFTGNLLYQLLAFALVSAAALAATKPLVSRMRSRRPAAALGLERNIGRRAVVVQPVRPGLSGRVRLDGVDWSAVCPSPLEAGDECVVTAVDSTTLRVEPARQPAPETPSHL